MPGVAYNALEKLRTYGSEYLNRVPRVPSRAIASLEFSRKKSNKKFRYIQKIIGLCTSAIGSII